MEYSGPASFDVGVVKSEIFPQLGLEESNPGVFAGQWFGGGPWIEKRSPIDGSFLGRVASADREDYERAASAARSAAKAWSGVPAPRRGEVVRRLAERLRRLKQPLGLLVTLEVGKIFAEGAGEVQEMIDICDFANGLSRQLYGLTIASERPNHRILENWHPLGLIGDSLRRLAASGGKILYGGESLRGANYTSENYVTPCIAEASNSWPVVQQETFAPILYVLSYKELDEAIEIHNQVPQGLSSAIFSANIAETEKFTSYAGSDCGIANVNLGTSGAEIGGAFGGEKETGGDRESGSDAWRAYMRRQTVTINYGSDLPLAQGIRFE